MDQSFYGLGKKFQDTVFKHKGITSLYDWQKECLTKHGESERNLIYSVPTSGGKTLVAEILMLKELFICKKNAVFIVPFVSIVQEKVSTLSALALDFGFWVEEYAGSKGAYPPTKHRKKNSLYICTIEKGAGLINSLIEENRLSEVGIVVIDEIHLIGEPRRGALLENVCIKLKALSVKIVGMSATIGNLKDLQMFLGGELYTHDFRPGSLKEFVKIEEELFVVRYVEDEPQIEYVQCLPQETNKEIRMMDPDGLGALVQDVIPFQSCLVFCQSKKNCENVAQLIVQTIRLGNNCEVILKHREREKMSLIKAVKMENNDVICPILEKTIPFGIVYHHSGITISERKLIEEAYSVGTISCICCTSTLAAGVNLPAQRVILRAPYVGSQFMSKSTYKQMIGRAGRAGLAEKGESYLICKPQQAGLVRHMLANSMDCCKSQLAGEDLKTFIVSCFSLKLAQNKESLQSIWSSSFAKLCRTDEDMEQSITEVVDALIGLRVLDNNENLSLTKFGKAIAKANISCEDGRFLMEELIQAQRKLVLIGDLHLLYLVTPHVMVENLRPVQEVIASMYANLKPKELYVASCLGISELVIARIMMGKPPPKSTPVRILEKFFVCLILYQLWRGNDVLSVANAYKVDRGAVHNLLLTTTSYAASVIRFCEAIESFWPFVKLLSVFPDRLNYCCSVDLIPLMELPGVKIGRAKQLHKAGFKTVLSIAKADPASLTRVILHLPYKQAVQIVDVAKLKVQTKYETLQEEAEEYLLKDIVNNTNLTVWPQKIVNS
uniref:Helicase POLQ-like n=2 Tax=Lygus hesperus TaxID=30085 RepID=A0A0A9X7V1_LYGHE